MTDHPAVSRLLDIVLDTNIVLDWLVFGDSAVAYMDAALVSRAVRVFACSQSIDELRRVLGYPKLALTAARQEEVLRKYELHTIRVDMTASGQHGLRCRDPDDQYLLSLAFCTRADALISRDKELLRLAKRADARGLKIIDTQRLRRLLRPVTRLLT